MAADEGKINKYEEGSYQYKWGVDNCAEIWSARDAILKGARYDNLVIRTEKLLGGICRAL